MNLNRFAILPSLLAVALMAACTPGTGADGKSSASKGGHQETASKLVADASKGSMKLDKLMEKDARDGLVPGVVSPASQSGTPQIVWFSKGLQYIIPSEPLDSTGTGINKDLLVKAGILMAPDKVSDAIANEGFIVGKSGPVVTAFVDPNCGYCNMFYTKIMPLVDAGKLRVRFVMVAFLRPSSEAISANILADSNPAAALKRDESDFKKRSGSKDEKIPEIKNPAMIEKVKANTAMWHSIGGNGTPTLAFCEAGKEITVKDGMPQDLDGLIASLDRAPKDKACK